MTRRAPFAVAAGHALTADAAAEALRAGGNAVDAAIAGAFAACVAEPVLASLYGGGFLMVRRPSGETRLLDFFVQTPSRKAPFSDIDLRAVEADFGEARQVFHIGAGAVAAPGAPAGLAEAHDRAGRMPFAELAAPAVVAAREGVALTAFQAKVMGVVAPILTASDAGRALYCGDDGGLRGEGERIRNPVLADVIDTYAREGPRFLMEGEPAQALLSIPGGHLGADDLKRYQPRWRSPLRESRPTRRGAMDLALNPPPALGGALIAFALRLIEDGDGPEALARAFAAAARARIETALDDDPAAGALRLFAPDLLARYGADIARARAAIRGTTHISVVDGDGMGAALTLSNGAGAGLIVPGAGMMPNNMLGEEDLVGPDLDWGEGQRLSSMMAPIAASWPDGGAAMLGSGGSSRIRTALAQVVVHIAGGARLEDAVAAPRIHAEDDAPPDFEDLLGEEARERLMDAAPEARPWPGLSMYFGGVHAVARDAGGGVEAAADPRRDGAAIIG